MAASDQLSETSDCFSVQVRKKLTRGQIESVRNKLNVFQEALFTRKLDVIGADGSFSDLLTTSFVDCNLSDHRSIMDTGIFIFVDLDTLSNSVRVSS